MMQEIVTQSHTMVAPPQEGHIVSTTSLESAEGKERSAAISTLQLRLLGGFELISDDKDIGSVDVPRVQSLLAYLALHHTAPQSRTHLAYVFWPDSTDPQAHTNLRNLIHKLRQCLPVVDRFLQVDGHTIQLNCDASWNVDVHDFEQAVAQAAHAKDPTVMRLALLRAVEVYRGDLVPGCYDEWMLPERDRLRQLYLEALEQLIGSWEQARDHAAAIRAAQRFLQHDPLQERAYRHLMRLYALNGDRAAALNAYHSCATILERELGTEPGRATREVYERLIQGRGLTGPLSLSSTPLIASIPLVGRTQEWLPLQAAWRSASAGKPQMIVLTGEAGIGKTRLAEELLNWVGKQGILRAGARCYAAERRSAYAPVSAWLRSELLRSGLSNLADSWLAEIARFVPDLLEERPDLPHLGSLVEGWQRQRLFEALARAFLSVHRPLLLVLDDIQWCDSETLEWLHYLLHFDPQAALLLLGTLRSEEVTTHHPVESLMLTLRRDGLVREIPLNPLEAHDTAALARHVAGRALSSHEASILYRETEGNPLFVVETVRAGILEQSGTERAFDDESPQLLRAPFPPTMQAVIESRLAQLTPLAHEVACVAALIGRAFTFEALVQASGLDEDALVCSLDELWQRRIIREQGEDTYDFSHDKLREGVLASLSCARQRLLHRRVTEVGAKDDATARRTSVKHGTL